MKASKVISDIKTRLDIPSSSQKIVQPDTINCRWTLLADAADSQCPTCQALRTGVDLFESWTPAEDRQRLKGPGCRVILEPTSSHVRMQIIGPILDDSFNEPTHEFRQIPQSSTLRKCEVFPIGSFESRGTRTSSSFEFCKHRLQDCLQNHRTMCNVGSKRFPHRVVRIGERTGEDFSLQLYETNAAVGEYAALSHCWGATNRVVKTTTQTLADWKSAIPWNKLSKTFQDAILITQQLGLDYIWIDSLCIIQDDASDWEMESALMGDVYGNATITIAAVTSKDGDSGCLKEVKPLVYDHPNVRKETSMTIHKRPTHEAYQYFRVEQERDRPLFSRAWTLQEELLAPRVLYFDAQEVIFQCRATLDCQCAVIQKDIDGHRFKSTKQEFAEVHGRDLPFWLSWESHSQPIIANPRRQISFLAPSWSWASRPIGDPITYPLFTLYGLDIDVSFVTDPHVLETSCELAGLDSTGAIKSGSLCIRGRLVPAVLKAWNLNDIGKNHQVCKVQRGGWEAKAQIDSPQQGGEFLGLDGQGVFCLLLYNAKIRRYGSMLYPDSAYYLILGHRDQAGQYKRIGIGYSDEVYFSEDCEFSSIHRPGLVDIDWDMENEVRSQPIMEAWFNDAEEREITLI